MRIKRFLAGLMAALMLTGCVAVPAFAYSGEEDNTVAESETASLIGTLSSDSSETEVVQLYKVTANDDGTFTVCYNGVEFTLDGANAEDDGTIGTGKVVYVNSFLNLRDGAGMSANVIGHLLPNEEVTVLGISGDWYQVSTSEQTGYVYKDYLTVTLNDTDDDDDSKLSEDMVALLMLMMMQGLDTSDSESVGQDTSDTESTGLTPDGNLSLIDDIGSSSEAGQQFITLTTKAGNVFYLVIDRDDDGNENVHFLNLVDEADLYALLDEDTQAEKDAQAAAETTEPAATEPEATQSEATEVVKPATETSSNWAPSMLLVIAIVGGVGGFLYTAFAKKQKQREEAKPDPDADYEDEDDAGYELPQDMGEEESDDVELEEDNEPV